MTGPEVLDLARDAITVLLQVAGPIMAIALVVGLIIALIQALTQVQEMTLVFVPKIASIFVALIFLLPFMSQVLNAFMYRIVQQIISG